MYHFDAERNTYPGHFAHRPDSHYVLGIDFGWHDATATSLNYWRQDYSSLVEVESWKQPHMDLAGLAARVRSYMDLYPTNSDGSWTLLADPAHRQLFEEFRRQYDLPVMEAEKAQKSDAIAVANTALRQGQVLIVDPRSSPHVKEMQRLRWRVRPDGKRVEQEGQKNDCCDAWLMAFRHARHYIIGQPEPTLMTAAEMRIAERDALRAMDREARENAQEGEWNEF